MLDNAFGEDSFRIEEVPVQPVSYKSASPEDREAIAEALLDDNFINGTDVGNIFTPEAKAQLGALQTKEVQAALSALECIGSNEALLVSFHSKANQAMASHLVEKRKDEVLALIAEQAGE